MSGVVRLENVSKSFEDTDALSNVSLSIEDQEFVTFLGPSGAGKSTLLKLIAGFINQTTGEIYIRDEPMSKKAPYERNIGMVFQSMELFPHMTVAENISFPLKMRRQKNIDIDVRVGEMLDLVEMSGYGSRDVSELSGGQQQRVAIARALSFEPELLLLDEPLSSLDKKLKESMREEFLRIHKETGVTTIHVTHDQKDALVMADRIAVVNEGEIKQFSSAKDLYNKPKTPFVASFVGSTNMFTGELKSRDGKTGIIRLNGGKSQIRSRVVGNVSSGDRIKLAFRHENGSLSTGSTDSSNAIEGHITNKGFYGNIITYSIKSRELDKEIKISQINNTSTQSYQIDDKVNVCWEPSESIAYGI